MNLFVDLNIRKSPYSIHSVRSFEKIDQFFSYLGGLFGFILLGFFLVSYYNTASFEVDMADKLFYYSPEEPLEPKRYNFFTYIRGEFYNVLRALGCSSEQDKREKYFKCREQVNEQLDVALLLNKIAFFQTCMSILFEEHQFRTIFLQQKPTVYEAQALRVNHGLNKIIHQNFIKGSADRRAT